MTPIENNPAFLARALDPAVPLQEVFADIKQARDLARITADTFRAAYAGTEYKPVACHVTEDPAPAKRPLSKLQLLVRQPTYTRRQAFPSNFTPWLCKQRPCISESTTLPLIDLLTMLDSAPAGLRFVAVCKNSTRDKHVLTVLDLSAKRFYRATSPTGIASFLKGFAKRHPHVQLLDAIEAFLG